MRHDPPKLQLTLNGVHGITSQKMILFITTAVKTSNPTGTINISGEDGSFMADI
jgi:hypothetical protein